MGGRIAGAHVSLLLMRQLTPAAPNNTPTP